MGAGFVVLFGLVLVFTWGATAAFGLAPGDAPTGGYLVVNLALSAAAAVIAGMVAVGVGRSLLSAAALALALLLLGLLSPSDPSGGQPGWYPLTITVIGAVGVLMGAFLAPGSAPAARRGEVEARPGRP